MKNAPTVTTTKSIVQLRSQATKLDKEATGFVIASPEDVLTAATMLGKIATAKKLIEAESKIVLDKYKDLIAIEKARWSPSLELLAAADKKIRTDVLVYQNEQVVKAAKAEEAVLKSLSSGKIKNETTAMRKIDAIHNSVMPTTVTTGTASMSTRTTRKLVITNIDLVPRKYLVVDEAAIKKALKEGEEVPGVKMEEVKGLAIR